MLYNAELPVPDTRRYLDLTSAEPVEARGELSSSVDSPLLTVVFMKSEQDRWKFQLENKQSDSADGNSQNIPEEWHSLPVTEHCSHFVIFSSPFSLACCQVL